MEITTKVRYKLMRLWFKIRYHKVFRSKEEKALRKKNALALYNEIMSNKK
jgi:hypothetical protein